MTTNTMVAIQTVTLGSSQSSITFGTGGTIPQTYTDLMIVCSPTNNQSINAADFTLNFNGDTTSGLYSQTILTANGSLATSKHNTGNNNSMYLTYYAAPSSGNPSTWIINIQNYANTTTYKTVLARGNNAASGIDATVGLWRNTNAITSILVSNTVGTFSAGSTFTLYGIANADIGAYATGGIITQDSTYYYHAFGSSGTFTPSRALTADILVVAGGGGGGGYVGGGGGAGGLLLFASQSLSNGTGYTCTVGAGGAGAASGGGGNGNAGSNSQFGALTVSVGGGYGSGFSTGAGTGGSGGSGGGATQTGSQTGGSPTSSQGYAGGNANDGINDYPSGGGGGAGAAGANGSHSGSNGQGGAGGIGAGGTSWTFTGVTNPYLYLDAMGAATSTGVLSSGHYYYAAGGGGGVYHQNNPTSGAGGLGGGGAAGVGTGAQGSDALVNTGSGGGGSSGPNGGSPKYAGGAGGSGIIIVRYAK